MKKPILIGMLLFIIAFPSLSQNQNKSEILKARKQQVYDQYRDSYVAHVLTGKKYNFELTKAKSHPLFLSKRPQQGTLLYDNVLFNDIEIEYNLMSQQVIVLLESKNNERYVSIDNEKVSSFSIKDFNFLHIRNDSILKDGIYQLAFEGKNSTLLIKHKKNQEEILTDSYLTLDYHLKNVYFVKNEFGTFQITGKKSLLKAFNQSKVLAAMLKAEKIKLSKKNMERNLRNALSIFDNQIAVGE